MLYNYILICLAIIPVILLGCYVYFKDKDKEPKKLIFKLFICGILSALLTLIITFTLENTFSFLKEDYTQFDEINLFMYVFLVIGLVEELSKWIFLYLFSYHNKEFDQLYDMVVYSVFVALGFAFIENILYVYSGGIVVAIIRGFSSIPCHVSMGVFMGYYLSGAKLFDINNKKRLKIKYIILSILIPSILHGIYDYCLSSSNFILLFVVLLFIIILFYQANKKLKVLSKLETNLNK